MGLEGLLRDQQVKGPGCPRELDDRRLLGFSSGGVGLTGMAALWSVTAFTKLSASGVAERMLSTRPSWNRRMDALS